MAAKNGASGGGGIDGVLASVMDSGAPSPADAAWESAIWTGRIGESRLPEFAVWLLPGRSGSHR